MSKYTITYEQENMIIESQTNTDIKYDIKQMKWENEGNICFLSLHSFKFKHFYKMLEKLLPIDN